MSQALHGLYAITPTAPHPRPLTERVAEAIAGGARLIQFRDKGTDARAREQQARALLDCCRAGGARLIINDDLALAARIHADGVHLGRDDGDPRAARALLGEGAIIGVSCYDALERARRAAAAGASYVAFGSFFASPTKPAAVRATPELLDAARREIPLPRVAIGGITPQNGGLLIAAGADMLAVVSGVFAAPDVAVAARAYTSLFPKESS
ncbi:thiamine phosphate synthase [Marichromatium sp. AB32]|uniref:thiamine phosphate synthase n=1 Tax=Marichromatium sp. AB32 TaxID=2483363 RepID=UPI000F3BA444|nr:thiamine phosphate synthase [Marichromatium sp. AB32]MBO8085525.1 thiamine phosphate synthase [Marichromatium sp.]RNE90693.1 thiamine phosphate synthase [Marichromatium sp. AB32]